MVKWCGWAGSILRVNLSKEKAVVERLNIDLARMYLGGRGMNARILYDEVGPGVEPLGSENLLIFGVGPLDGTFAPTAGRYTATAKSPLTGAFGDANSGGHFGAEMKYAGYDAMVFYGRAGKPSYIWVDDDRVEFRDASDIWGSTTWSTDKMIKEEVGDQKVQIACIGPAGENLVKFASIICNFSRAAGRCGMGAVMGSKNLKAVAVRGTKGVRVANPQAFERAVDMAYEKIYNAPSYDPQSTLGTPLFLSILNECGVLATRNWLNGAFEKAEDICGEEFYETYSVKNKACFACPIHCSHFYLVRGGRFGGVCGEGVEFETLCAFGSKCGNSNLASILYMNNLANQYGLDTISTGTVLAFAMECYEKGLITTEDTSNIRLDWGNYEAMISMIKKIVRREGFGDMLAEGLRAASEKIGKGSEKFAMHVKGLELPAGDLRGLKGFALGHAVASRGGDHLRALVNAEAMWTPERAEKVTGTRKAADRLAYDGKPMLVKWHEELCAIADSLNVCKRVVCSLYALDWNDLSLLVSSATGLEIEAEELRLIGERIVNLERCFNVREGFSRIQDTLPRRFFYEAIPEGASRGELIGPDRFDEMLNRYYKLRGWNEKGGIPLKQKLRQLNLINDEREERATKRKTSEKLQSR